MNTSLQSFPNTTPTLGFPPSSTTVSINKPSISNESNRQTQNPSFTNDSPSKLAYSHSTIEETLQCPVCFDRFHEPRALPCQHVFCRPCLKRITSSNILCSIITCPLCRRIYPYNSSDQFPISYIHNQLLDLVPINFDLKGKCSKCKETHILNLCACCDYHLCPKCYKNDRENMLINLENILQTCYTNRDSIQIISSEINDLLTRGDFYISNPQTVEFNDIILLFYHLKYFYDQVNKLPITYAKRTDDNDENLLTEQMRNEPIDCFSVQEQIDDDDDIIYLETVQPILTPTLDEQIHKTKSDE